MSSFTLGINFKFLKQFPCYLWPKTLVSVTLLFTNSLAPNKNQKSIKIGVIEFLVVQIIFYHKNSLILVVYNKNIWRDIMVK